MLVLLGTSIGRLLGFVRETMLASRLGLAASTDVAIVSFTFADLMTNLLIAGSLSGVLIPEFARLVGRSSEDDVTGRDDRLFWLASIWVVVGPIVVSLLAIVASPQLVRALAPGLDPAPSPVRLRPRLTRCGCPGRAVRHRTPRRCTRSRPAPGLRRAP
jgi:putative peptidoglycan lipid II flippase